MSTGRASTPGDAIVAMVEASRYEEALGVSLTASKAEATAAFIRLSGRFSSQDRVRVALNKARGAMLSETESQKGVRLSRLRILDARVGALRQSPTYIGPERAGDRGNSPDISRSGDTAWRRRQRLPLV